MPFDFGRPIWTNSFPTWHKNTSMRMCVVRRAVWPWVMFSSSRDQIFATVARKIWLTLLFSPCKIYSKGWVNFISVKMNTSLRLVSRTIALDIDIHLMGPLIITVERDPLKCCTQVCLSCFIHSPGWVLSYLSQMITECRGVPRVVSFDLMGCISRT